jgi:pantoate--beta-alanine ligase
MEKTMMIATSLNELRDARRLLEGTIGFVPTMGYLHEGHISLVHRAREECDHVITSIFVNPTQFGANEDLSKYPRDLKHDLTLLEAAGLDLVWTPTPELMYPSGFATWVEVEGLTGTLEGAARPGHFRGVTTIVTKLFNAVQPHKAYFGQKDAQQAAVIRRMTRDLDFPIEIVVCPTLREADGLAMSSRNSYLSPEQRTAATAIFRALTTAKSAYERGERNAKSLRKVMQDVIVSEPRAQMQYVSVADYDSLEELETLTGKTLLSMAVFMGKTRLIDNFVLE